jgi:hypothetical protein
MNTPDQSINTPETHHAASLTFQQSRDEVQDLGGHETELIEAVGDRARRAGRTIVGKVRELLHAAGTTLSELHLGGGDKPGKGGGKSKDKGKEKAKDKTQDPAKSPSSGPSKAPMNAPGKGQGKDPGKDPGKKQGGDQGKRQSQSHDDRPSNELARALGKGLGNDHGQVGGINRGNDLGNLREAGPSGKGRGIDYGTDGRDAYGTATI